MIDAILSLAFSMHSNRGVYALLLGSGVSRSAGIPTGWEIVVDLIRKLAHLKGESCEPDPAGWYRAVFGEEADYAKVLGAVAGSPLERSQLLRSYFEPSDEEREQGLKVPTGAHKAIAELVARDHVRILLTTNFDRLLENALEAAGIVPTVVSTPDATKGVVPLAHSKCLVVKLHGDYLDSRIKNTPRELAKYDERMNQLLDRVLDEFGLLVCGWSGDWDTALRAAIERCSTHRFTTYWTVKGDLREPAERLTQLRRAKVLTIQDADSFFQELVEKVMALDDLSRPHPLSARVAVATVKRYLVDDAQRIRLNDLLMAEVEKLYAALPDEHSWLHAEFDPAELRLRVQRYEALAEVLVALMATGCYWGGSRHEALWARCLTRIGSAPRALAGKIVWLGLRAYPALLLLYAGGLASIAAERYGTLAALLTQAMAAEESDRRPAGVALYPWAVMDQDVGRHLPGQERHFTPLSDHLLEVMREPLREFLPDDLDYERCFDRFEYMLALVHADLRLQEGHGGWAPIGRFGWRGRHDERGRIGSSVEVEINDGGQDWPPLRAGLFGGSLERLRSAKTTVDTVVGGLSWR